MNIWTKEAEEAAKNEEGKISFHDLLLLSVGYSLERIADSLDQLVGKQPPEDGKPK